MRILSRILASFLLLLFFVATGFAQTFTAAGGSVVMDVGNRAAISVQIDGTHTGLGIAFEITNNGTSWVNIACETYTVSAAASVSATTNGIYVCPVGAANKFRARVASLTTGSVTLSFAASNGTRFLPTPSVTTAAQGGTWAVEATVPNTVSTLVTNFGSNILSAQSNGFSATTAFFTPPATPTDNCIIGGSASTTIKVTEARVYGLATAARPADFLLIKRNAANTAGTFVSATIIPHDSDNASLAPVVGHYTANPTINGTVGTIGRKRILLYTSAIANLADLNNTNMIPYGSVIELNGTAQQLAINHNGTALVGGESWACEFTWFEESE